MKKNRMIMLTIAGSWLVAATSMAAITATSNNFSTSIGSWVSVGSITPKDILRDSSSDYDFYDGDDTQLLPYAPGMLITGDGLLYDGGLRLDTINAIAGDEAMGLTIDGTMEEGEVITFSGNLYNDNTSYTGLDAQLWNLTDDVLLSGVKYQPVRNYNHNAYAPVDFTVSYIAQAADAGDTLQIRFLDSGGTATARDIFVDNFDLSSVPPSAGITQLIWDFNSDGPTGTELAIDVAQYDYTSAIPYVGSNAVANTLAFNGKSGSTDYIIRDKGGLHTSSLYLKTVNTAADDFGVYFQKLDFTLGGQNATNLTRVEWSFDILGYNQNGNLDPTDWTVKINTDNTSQNLNVSDGWYSNAVSAQTFSFLDDSTGETALNGTWTTVTGSYDIAVGSAGTAGGIQISTDNGGYTSSGGIFLDNISITISGEEPVLSEMYAAWAAGFGLTNSPAADPETDYDGDRLSNLDEYGLGGNPTNFADTGYSPLTSSAADGGTNWFYYVYPERNDAALAGLNYSLETDDDLVSAPGWTDAVYEESGTAANGFGAGFNAITNRVSTEGKTQEFIQLQINGL